jgi:cytoskeletal protein RodZ
VTTSTETSGNSPGSVLKRCREYHEISLEEASEATKIGISYLKALEEDQVSGFANLTYLKGFLRIYATYLGLNPDDMSRMYDKLYGTKDVKSSLASSAEKRDRPTRSMIPLRKLLLPAILLLLIVITAALFKRQPSTSISISRPVATPSMPSAESAVQPARSSTKIKPIAPLVEEAKPENKASAANAPDKSPAPKKTVDSGKGFILKIKVTQNGTLSSVVDGAAAQQYELTVGDVIEWKAEKSVALDLSNGGGVDVELNGKPYRQLGPSGKPTYVVLDAEGMKP